MSQTQLFIDLKLTDKQIFYLSKNKLSLSKYQKIGSVVLGEYNEDLVLEDADKFILFLEVLERDYSFTIVEIRKFIDNKELSSIIDYMRIYKFNEKG